MPAGSWQGSGQGPPGSFRPSVLCPSSVTHLKMTCFLKSPRCPDSLKGAYQCPKCPGANGHKPSGLTHYGSSVLPCWGLEVLTSDSRLKWAGPLLGTLSVGFPSFLQLPAFLGSNPWSSGQHPWVFDSHLLVVRVLQPGPRPGPPGHSFHLRSLRVATSVKSLLPCQVTDSQGPVLRIRAPQGAHFSASCGGGLGFESQLCSLSYWASVSSSVKWG